MQTTGIEQVTYLQFLEVDILPPPSPRLKNVELVLRGVGKRRCTGTAWVDAAGGSTVGSLDATSPIAGNPVGLQTPGQLAATIQAQAAEIAALKVFLTDDDLDGRLDANKQQDKPFSFPTAQPTWTINHNLGRRPAFELFDLIGKGLPQPPRQDPTLNTTIFTWLIPQAGTATAI